MGGTCVVTGADTVEHAALRKPKEATAVMTVRVRAPGRPVSSDVTGSSHHSCEHLNCRFVGNVDTVGLMASANLTGNPFRVERIPIDCWNSWQFGYQVDDVNEGSENDKGACQRVGYEVMDFDSGSPADAGGPTDDLVELVGLARLVPDSPRRCVVLGSTSDVVARALRAAHPACDVTVMGRAAPLRLRGLDAVIALEDAFDVPDGAIDELLHSIGASLRPGGILIGRVRSSRHASVVGPALRGVAPLDDAATRFDRPALVDFVARAGLDLGDVRARVDPALEIHQPPIDGMTADVGFADFILRDATAIEFELLSSSWIVFTGTRPMAADAGDRSPILCSVLVALTTTPRAPEAYISALIELLTDPCVEVVVVGGRAADAVLAELSKLAGKEPSIGEVRDRLSVLQAVEPHTPARLWNMASRRSRGRYLAFLHGDVVPDAWWSLEPMWEFASNASVGVVGTLVLDPDGLVESAGFSFGPQLPLHTVPFPLHVGADPAVPAVNVLRRVGAVAIDGSMVRRSTFLDLGGLDERYLGADVGLDLCMRMRSRGLTCVFTPHVTIRRNDALAKRSPRADHADRERFIGHWGGRLVVDGDPSVPEKGGSQRVTSAPPLPILWTGILLDRTGYGNEGRSMVLGLDRMGVDVRANPILWGELAPSLGVSDAQRLHRSVTYEAPDRFIHIIHSLPSFNNGVHIQSMFERAPRAVLNVARTMFETDRIPDDWVQMCNQMDQVWVPSQFNVETFSRSGVDADKLHAVPSPISPELFAVDLTHAELPGSECFAFLSVFAWGLRKGWDVLVQAFVEEFERGEAKLLMKVTPAIGFSVQQHRDRTVQFIEEVLGLDSTGVAEILFVDGDMDMTDLARLYRSTDAFVLPSRGEGWGRPYMEAMAAGLPTIGSRWGGNLDFMNDANSYLVDCGEEDVSPEGAWEVPQYAGHRWAAPSVEHLRQQMRRVVEHPSEAAGRAARGRSDVLGRYGNDRVAKTMVSLLDGAGWPAARLAPPQDQRPLVRWEGPQFIEFGMAVVNRALCRRLAEATEIDLSVASRHGMEAAVALDPSLQALAQSATRVFDRNVDVTVRHEWPPDLSPPATGTLVIYQPWEYGSAPASWIEPMNEVAAEVWVPSRSVRDNYIRSGVDPAKLVVVPNAVDVERYTPEATPTDLRNKAAFRFLFVGGTLWRKGADILLDTYLRTFTAGDDVCLVVKDFGVASFYEGQGIGEAFRRAADDPSAPAIELIDWDLTSEAAAGLYTACHCLVHPYRGEGFALPIAEAMASGLPVIVPRYGPCLDYCDDTVAHLIATSEVTSSETRIGGLATVAGPWWGEIDRSVLADAMRKVVDRPDDARAMGIRGARRIRDHTTWDRPVRTILDRVQALSKPGGPVAQSTERRTLTVCMIVKDEAHQMSTAMKSISAVADEIVVVDTGSTDGTDDIARAFGAEVHYRPWTGSFADARNEAIALASKDWILMLDADQRFDADSIEELLRITQVELPVGYLLRQFNYTAAEGRAEFVEHLIVRLFPNHPAIRYEGDVHEQVVCSDPTLSFPQAMCGVVLHHEGYRPQFRNPIGKAERDKVALEGALDKDPDDPFAHYNLGITYRTLGNEAGAVRHLRRAVALGTSGRQDGEEPAFLLHARVEIVRALLGSGLVDEALKAAEEAVAVAPQSPDAQAVLGAACLIGGRLDQALAAYRRVSTCPDAPALAPTDRSLIRWRGALGEGQVLGMQGRWEEALEALSRARSASNEDPSVLLVLADVYYGMGDRAQSVATLLLVTARPDGPPAGWMMLADALRSIGDGPGAADAIRQGLVRFPSDPDLFDRMQPRP